MHSLKIVVAMILVVVAGNYFLAQPTANAVFTSAGLPRPFEVGEASYYSYECAQLPMANGKPFDPEKRTCASWFYKLGTVLAVKSIDTGRTTKVTVTDRGPNRRLVKKGRVIDLSKRAFEDISTLQKGLTHVTVTVISRPDIS